MPSSGRFPARPGLPLAGLVLLSGITGALILASKQYSQDTSSTPPPAVRPSPPSVPRNLLPAGDPQGPRWDADAYLAPAFDRTAARVAAMDFERQNPGIHRFAHPLPIDLEPSRHGRWNETDPETLSWICVVRSPGALSLSLAFTDFLLPDGAVLTLSHPRNAMSYTFNSLDNEDHGQLWTPLLDGDQILLSLTLPRKARHLLRLRATRLHHGLVPQKSDSSEPGSYCHIDTSCQPGDLDGLGALVESFRPQARAAVAYSLEGTDACSGVLLNNTAGDGTPYLLTAYHCGIDASNAPSMIVYWNYENPSCRIPGNRNNGRVGNGSRRQFNSGAILRAAYRDSDFALVELDDPIHPEADPFFAGWSRSPLPPHEAVCVHHPQVFEKRICFAFSPTTITEFGYSSLDSERQYLRVLCWDHGTTEGGSSGSPLFDAAGLVTGQLRGGDSDCGNDASDWFGRFASSWEGGGTPITRLRDWLDPLNTGAETLTGSFLSPALSIADSSITEGDGEPLNLSFPLFLSEPPSAGVVVQLRLIPDSAEPGVDYGSPPALQVVIPAGSTAAEFSVPIHGDEEPEPDETFFVEVVSVAGAIAVTRRAAGWILNDDFETPLWQGLNVFDLQQDAFFETVLQASPGPNTYSFQEEPPPGMILDPDTGRLSWRPGGAGDFSVSLLASNPAGQSARRYDFRVAPNSLRIAADAPDLPLETGSRAWITDPTVSYDGPDSLASPSLADNESAWVETRVEGPELLRFWWKVSSEHGFDALHYSLDGVEIDQISGEVDWQRRLLSIPSGSHRVRWTYRKDSEAAAGADRGWLDGLQLAGNSPHPYIVSPLQVAAQTHEFFEYHVATSGESASLSTGPLPEGLSFDAGDGILSGAFSAPGAYVIQLEAVNAFGQDSVVLQILVSLPLGEALDAPALSWNTGGDQPWTGQPDASAVAAASAQSPELGDLQSSWIETQVSGPDALLFQWRTSSEEDFDFLTFARNGETLASLSGETGWRRQVFSLPSGFHRLRWTYAKDETALEGSDRAWLDAVRLASHSPAPILLSPARVLAPSGASLELQLQSSGTGTRFTAAGLPPGVSLTESGFLSGSAHPPGVYPASVTVANAHGSDAAVLELAFLPVIPSARAALESPPLTWFGQPEALWFRVEDPTGDDGDALRSAPIDDDEESWVETELQGPGVIHFRWKVSSETDFDFLRFEVNSREEASLSGSTGWLNRSHALAPGVRGLRWGFVKDDSVSAGQDAGWLDRIRLEGYAAWVLEQAGAGSLEAVDDPDLDGVVNLIEWAFALDPFRPDAQDLPQPEATPEGVLLTVPRLRGDPRLSYSVEVSNTLAPDSWSALELDILEDNAARLVVRDPAVPGQSRIRAFRIRILWK
ncbi:MAG TPA: putative Ig domain-containing protein [Verrucomicrobiales bacterium]|nr:putative Ig domain-containing protein [Verrucomicrobiales bacterium]